MANPQIRMTPSSNSTASHHAPRRNSQSRCSRSHRPHSPHQHLGPLRLGLPVLERPRNRRHLPHPWHPHCPRRPETPSAQLQDRAYPQAEEFLTTNPQETITAFDETFATFSEAEVTREPHLQFKERVPNAIGLIRTGDPPPTEISLSSPFKRSVNECIGWALFPITDSTLPLTILQS